MSELIERLRAGLIEAQRRHAEVTRRWQIAQAEFNASNSEVIGYQKVLELESKREMEQAAAKPSIVEPSSNEAAQVAADSGSIDVNKTQLVRDALAAHPGLTPAQVWGALRGQIRHRNYIYAVLKRLKDRDQITIRRGKYYLKESAAQEESEPKQASTLQ